MDGKKSPKEYELNLCTPTNPGKLIIVSWLGKETERFPAKKLISFHVPPPTAKRNQYAVHSLNSSRSWSRLNSTPRCDAIREGNTGVEICWQKASTRITWEVDLRRNIYQKYNKYVFILYVHHHYHCLQTPIMKLNNANSFNFFPLPSFVICFPVCLSCCNTTIKIRWREGSLQLSAFPSWWWYGVCIMHNQLLLLLLNVECWILKDIFLSLLIWRLEQNYICIFFFKIPLCYYSVGLALFLWVLYVHVLRYFIHYSAGAGVERVEFIISSFP